VPRLTLVRTAVRTACSSAAVSGLLTRSAQRNRRAIGQGKSRAGSHSGLYSQRLNEPDRQSSARGTKPARFVRTSWSYHSDSLAAICSLEKSPDTVAVSRSFIDRSAIFGRFRFVHGEYTARGFRTFKNFGIAIYFH
jgi:hypothetical protein